MFWYVYSGAIPETLYPKPLNSKTFVNTKPELCQTEG